MGPNGSGKSNVIDAMLFVFGRRAKQVRVRTAAHCVLRGVVSGLACRDATCMRAL